MQMLHVSEIIRFVLDDSSRWGQDCFVSSQDIWTAFDNMKHDQIAEALISMGTHPTLVAAILEELTGLSAKAVIPDAGSD